MFGFSRGFGVRVVRGCGGFRYKASRQLAGRCGFNVRLHSQGSAVRFKMSPGYKDAM